MSLLRTARLSLGSTSTSILFSSVELITKQALRPSESLQADYVKAHCIQFGVRLLADDSKNLFSVCADRSPARSWHLFSEFYYAIGGRDRIETAALHIV